MDLEGSSKVRQTTKTGVFKLSGKAKLEDNLKYTNVESVIGSDKDVNLNSDKNVSIVASYLIAGKDINIKAGEDVNILVADDKFKSEKKESKYSIKPFASAKGLKFEAGIKANYSQNKENNFSTKVKGSEISAGNNVNIESENNTNIQVSTILSENTNINTKGELNLLTKDEISINNMSGTEIEAKLSAKLDLSGIKETVKSVVDVVKGIPELPKAVNAAANLASGKDINESLEGNEEGIEEVSRILNGPKSGGVSAGIYASGSLEKTKSKTEVKKSVGSNILSKENISLSSEEDMKLKQVSIQGKNIAINSKKDILIESGVSTVETKASSQSLNGEVNLLTGQFNVGGGLSKDKSNEKTHTNSQIYGENIAIKTEDLRVKGGNIEADKVNIDAKNLHIESMQDEVKSKHQAINISVGKSSVGGGIEYGKHEKEWVKKQSSIIGREKAEINVAEKTNIVGAVIGGADTTLRTKELEFTNIEDKEKGYNIGMNASASFSKDKNEKTKVSKSGSASYDAVDRKQINRATIGVGRIIVDGKETSPNINRDESKAQEITKDVSVDKVGVEYSDNRRNWSEVATIMGEHGAALDKGFKEIFSALGKEYKYNLSENFEEAWLKLEEIVGVDLKQDFLGIIPTRRNYGGLFDQPFREDNADAFFADIEIKNSIKNSDGSLSVESIMNSLEDQFGNLKDVRAIDFGNGILNFKDGIAVSAGNQTLSPEVLKKLADSPESSVKVKVYYNPSHGMVGDLLESIQDIVGFYTGGAVSSANAKKLAKAIERNPKILENYTAHSQGTLILKNALNLIVREGKEELLKGKKIHMNGSPGNMEVMKEFAEKYGIEFTYTVNKKEPVTPIGFNLSNSTNIGHTSVGNDPTKGYNKFQKINPVTGKYEVDVGSEEEKDLKKVKYFYEDINLINDVNNLIEKTGGK